MKDPVFHDSNTFAAAFLPEVSLLQNLSGLNVHFAQRRSPIQARALVKESVMVDQSLRVSILIVWVGMNDRKRIFCRTFHTLSGASTLSRVSVAGGKEA